jgi:hypothetical protein
MSALHHYENIVVPCVASVDAHPTDDMREQCVRGRSATASIQNGAGTGMTRAAAQASEGARRTARWSFADRRAAGVVTVIAPFNVPPYLAIRSGDAGPGMPSGLAGADGQGCALAVALVNQLPLRVST